MNLREVADKLQEIEAAIDHARTNLEGVREVLYAKTTDTSKIDEYLRYLRNCGDSIAHSAAYFLSESSKPKGEQR